ncbi:hypothetical protein FHR32_006912 [Streptosporangium album]|uniref:Uncharacterized protein n=1 Tax=Streptosporangium album TaxID=47479 RepID=A0A7W7WCY4_9ACTN|nr:hypothetical protein [Streptosporangium album]MBB4942526.1 hypothetical protein [Streptosporangium album]
MTEALSRPVTFPMTRENPLGPPGETRRPNMTVYGVHRLPVTW